MSRSRKIRLAGVGEVAELLGVSKQRASQLAKGDRWDAWFPEPLDHIGAGPVWRRADVERWAEERRNGHEAGVS